jgi:hypothetical protein
MQGMNKILQFCGYIGPFGFATAAIKSILVKGSTISNQDTYMGLIMPAIWIIVSIALSFWFIKKKK